MSQLRLELRASPMLAGTILLVNAAGAASLLATMPLAAGTALAALLLWLGAIAARSYALLRGGDAVRALEVTPEGFLRATLGDGREVRVAPLSRCHVAPWWVVAPVAGSMRRLLVVRDMLAPDEFRRLRIWALWGRLPDSARQQARRYG